MHRLSIMTVTSLMETVKAVVSLVDRCLMLIIGMLLFRGIFVKLSWFLVGFYHMSRNGVGV
jgi:hypothetical protein